MNRNVQAVYDNLVSGVLGSEVAAELLVSGILAEGHILIQGQPGSGKTSLAKILAASIRCPFTRIQFTPDLLPSDIVGYSIYDQAEQKFVFHQGAVFGQVILADEINRASPRTQSALLEAMSERQVSVDGKTYGLDRPFFVIATENHLSSAGTFPLPDSQLDRFLLSFEMKRPDPSRQVDVLALHMDGGDGVDVQPVMSREDVTAAQEEVCAVGVSHSVMRYVVGLCEATHEADDFVSGVSLRASIALMAAAKTQAYLDGRTHVYPDDVKRVMPYVLRHRLVMTTGGHRRHRDVENRLREILESVPVPTAPD
jgi:MoxR-like ATPase